MNTKRCPKCGETKALDRFAVSRSRRDGRDSHCKACKSREGAARRPLQRESRAAYMRKYSKTPKGRELSRAANRRRKANDPVKTRARKAIDNAIQRGKIKRQPCEVCGATEDIHAHHTDYSRALDVQWLCRTHHIDIHRSQTKG